MVAARPGCRCFTMRRQSVQLDQWAAGRTLDALVSPHPPEDNDRDERTCATGGALGVPKISRRHLHTSASCREAKPPESSGLTALNQKLARVDPHISSRSHTA